ncbi:PLP-dependent aminotransferase family protein [Anaerovoracaceae bacterium 41-7]
MKLKIDKGSSIPIYKQIAREIEKKILWEELPSGYKLPAERRLAEEIGVHRNTIIKAYDVLIAKELCVVSREKPKGYFVKVPQESQEFGKRFFPLEKAFRYEFRKAEKRFNDIYWKSEPDEQIPFGGLIMDRRLNPVQGMEHVVSRIFDSSKVASTKEFLQETERLRENVRKLLTNQNIYVTTKNIQIFAESNQTITYLMIMYLREGDCIVAEEPMVPDNYSIFYNRGIEVITIPMDEDGMKMDLLEEALRERKPKFIYTQPNYHNPTGITMSLAKRQTLLRLANTYNVPVIEEDYQKDFVYSDHQIPSLYALDANKMVIYVDTFTLTFPYMMKIGYAVGPPDLMYMMGYALSVDETTIGGIGQYFLNEYIESGEFEKHIRCVQQVYSARLNLLCEELDKISDKGITYKKPKGGLLLWCTLENGINERELFRVAEEKGVLITPGWVFYDNSHSRKGHIRLCFSNVTDEQIRRGVALLGQALDECKRVKDRRREE